MTDKIMFCVMMHYPVEQFIESPFSYFQEKIKCLIILQVLRNHPDFTNGANPSRSLSSTEPIFRIVRDEQTRTTVLVLDISGSMGGHRISKLNKVQRHCENNNEIVILKMRNVFELDLTLA